VNLDRHGALAAGIDRRTANKSGLQREQATLRAGACGENDELNEESGNRSPPSFRPQ
jgi:hypothetical protein